MKGSKKRDLSVKSHLYVEIYGGNGIMEFQSLTLITYDRRPTPHYDAYQHLFR